jgi:glycosyltransferase involved in cell wall biosynthesis
MKVCQAFTQLGHETRLVVPGSGSHAWSELKEQYGVHTPFNIEWLPANPALHKLDFNWNAVNKAKKEHADVIYTRLLWAAIFALYRRVPVILEMHEVPSGRFAPQLYKHYLARSGRRLTVFITRALQNEIEKKLNIQHRSAETFIAPDGVDLERYADLPSPEQARKALGLKNTITAVYSGGFYPGRGLEILFDLAAAFPQVQFMWIGGKPEILQEWKEKISSAGLTNVVLPGFIANEKLPAYQAAADILLMPYRQKVAGSSGGDISSVTSPMKLFEYMACGRAILCSDLPVLHEVLTEDFALFYPPDDLPAMSAAFSRLLEDEKLRLNLGERTRNEVTRYSWRSRMQTILHHFADQILE